MKKAFTLIELIFAMVIIAIAFSVLPKVLYMATKASITSLKEEAMYNAVAYAGLIRASAWDENNTEVDDILIVNGSDRDTSFDCDQNTSYRVGGFTGSRNCFNDKNASVLGMDSNDNNLPDDIDDFKEISVVAKNENSSRKYDINATVEYVDDTFFATSLSDNSDPESPTNSKRIEIIVYPKRKSSELGNSMVKLNFTLYNIGQLRVNKRRWN